MIAHLNAPNPRITAALSLIGQAKKISENGIITLPGKSVVHGALNTLKREYEPTHEGNYPDADGNNTNAAVEFLQALGIKTKDQKEHILGTKRTGPQTNAWSPTALHKPVGELKMDPLNDGFDYGNDVAKSKLTKEQVVLAVARLISDHLATNVSIPGQESGTKSFIEAFNSLGLQA